MAKSTSISAADETVDSLLRGRLSVIQKRTGYRFSLDALLLAHFAAPKKSARVVDLGAGSGVVALTLALLHPTIEVVGVELQTDMADRAKRSAALNRLSGRVTILEGDVRAVDRLLRPASFAAAVANPPYRLAASGRINPDREKQLARHEIAGNLGDFLRAAGYLLERGGKVAVIYPASRMVDLLYAMREGKLEPKRLRLVHSSPRTDASLVLAEGIKEGRAELKILPPLSIYNDKREYTREVAAILAGNSLPEL